MMPTINQCIGALPEKPARAYREGVRVGIRMMLDQVAAHFAADPRIQAWVAEQRARLRRGHD